jgi:hypothetical protein
MAWESEYPQLSAWLRERSLADAESDHTRPYALNAPAPFAEWARQAEAIADIGPLPPGRQPNAPHKLSVDVPGRKWTQIQAFARHAVFEQPVSHWIDWCAGKGHLGRLLAQSGAGFTALEYDAALVDAGKALSARHQLHGAHHVHQDVLAADCDRHLGATTTPVALHACGDLHVALIQKACTAGAQSLAIAPCCYNRTASVTYVSLSEVAKRSLLRLDRKDLGLPLMETVTAGQRVRLQRDESMARRLAFDLLQRQIRGNDEYLPTPPLDASWLKKPLPEFCIHLAQRNGLAVPDSVDWEELHHAGRRRLAEVRNLELVRGLFRRPLEIWLLLDRAMRLREAGYRVKLGTFCEASVTPRNLMVLANR